MAFPDLLAVADRAVQGQLGGTITYEPALSGNPQQIPGVFDAAALRTDVGEVSFLTPNPQVFVLLSDLRAAFGADYDPAADDPEITVGEKKYRVREPRADGFGGVLLFLTEKD